MTKYRIVKKMNTDSQSCYYSFRFCIQKQWWFGMWVNVDWHYSLDSAMQLLEMAIKKAEIKQYEPDEVVWEGEK